jgi:quinone-reactive Ni/Fe-hydrogenase large subunit
MESGPLARVLISYKKGNKFIKPFVDDFLTFCDLELLDLSSSVGRNAARAIESAYISEYIFKFINQLVENIKYYDTETWTKYAFDTLPKEAKGRTFLEVPRGVLSHFINIEEQKIQNYQVIAPTTWH